MFYLLLMYLLIDYNFNGIFKMLINSTGITKYCDAYNVSVSVNVEVVTQG